MSILSYVQCLSLCTYSYYTPVCTGTGPFVQIQDLMYSYYTPVSTCLLPPMYIVYTPVCKATTTLLFSYYISLCTGTGPVRGRARDRVPHDHSLLRDELQRGEVGQRGGWAGGAPGPVRGGQPGRHQGDAGPLPRRRRGQDVQHAQQVGANDFSNNCYDFRNYFIDISGTFYCFQRPRLKGV